MAWVHSTLSPRKYLKSMSPETAMINSAAVYSEAFDYDMSDNGYMWVGINISTLGSAVVATLKLQTSYDGITYTNALTLVADCDPEVTGYKMYYVDLTAYTAPFMRFVFNDGAAATGASGRFYFIIIGKRAGAAATDPYI